jgi:hypothetical protein
LRLLFAETSKPLWDQELQQQALKRLADKERFDSEIKKKIGQHVSLILFATFQQMFSAVVPWWRCWFNGNGVDVSGTSRQAHGR